MRSQVNVKQQMKRHGKTMIQAIIFMFGNVLNAEKL